MRLIVSPACEAQRLRQESAPSHLIRFVSPGSGDSERDGPGVLTLVAHDIDAPEPGRTAPDAALVARLLAASAGWTGERPLLLQCWAGVSRSTAAAFAIACQKRPDKDEGALAQLLRHASSQATPNRLMVALADKALGRDGRMTRAVEAIGRGSEFQGFAPFELRLA